MPASNADVNAFTLENSFDITAAVQFLLFIEPEGPWQLTAIDANGHDKATHTRLFNAHDESGLKTWIVSHQTALRNIYFTVAAVDATQSANKKPNKRQLKHTNYAFVDLDLDKSDGKTALLIDWASVGERQKRIARGMLQFDRLYRKHNLAPAVTVFTGGGITALFRISKPLDLTTENGITALEAINKQLIAEVDAPDRGTFNADRILRLPGTINYASDTKIKRGRVDLAATVLQYAEYNGAYAWDIDEFKVLFKRSAASLARDRKEIAAIAAEGVSCVVSDAELNALTNKKAAAAKKRLAEDVEDAEDAENVEYEESSEGDNAAVSAPKKRGRPRVVVVEDEDDPTSVVNILKWVSLPYGDVYLHMLRGWLHAVPCPDAYEDWYKYAIALKRLQWPDSVAFGLFDEFSKRSEYYSEDGVNAKWAQAHADITSRDRSELFTWRGIARAAMQCGYTPTEVQLEKIRENDFEPSQLEVHNESHAYVQAYRTVYAFDTNRFITREEHKTECENKLVVVGKGDKIKSVPLDVVWRRWPQRRMHKDVVFAPGEKRITDTNCINIWTGFNFDLGLLKGASWAYTNAVKCDFENLVLTLTNNSADEAHMLIEMLAFNLQNPGEKIYKAILLAHTTTGTGKSLLCELIAALHGPLHAANPSNDDLLGSFNEYMYAKTFIYCEETLTGDKRHLAQKLKAAITSTSTIINAKFSKVVTVAARALWIFSANEPDALWIDPQDRRYLVIAPQTRNTQEFYARVGAYKQSPVALAAIAEYLLSYDVSKFNPKEMPLVTAAKTATMELTRPEIDVYILDMCSGATGKINGRSRRFWTAAEVASAYHAEWRGNATVTAVGRAMARLNIPKMAGLRVTPGGGQGVYYALTENREAWREAEYRNWSEGLRDDRSPALVKREA